MSYYINMLFSTELTCFPQIIDKYIGNYYSNAVGNALTWVFFMWLLVHYVFDSYLNSLLKQMHYKEFIRIRLLNALWYCGFYGTGFLYGIGTIVRNNASLFDYRRNLVMDGGNIPLHILMGLGLIGTFFFQSFTWSCIKFGFDSSCLTFLTLTMLPVTTFYSRRTELLMSLLALISLVHFINNVLRCLTCTMDKKGYAFLNGLFFGSLGLFVLVHVVIVPIFFIVPLIYNLRYGLHLPVILLSANLILWWIAEAFSNPLYKYLEHWIKHADINNRRICPNNILDCCLFPMRDDFSYNMSLEKLEIKQREQKSIIRRKPKDRGVFVKTLKCMVAIRRKLKIKRASDNLEESNNDKDKLDAKSEDDSSEEESSSEQEEEDRMKREYQEETARALMEDKEESTDEISDDSEEKMKIVADAVDDSADDKKND